MKMVLAWFFRRLAWQGIALAANEQDTPPGAQPPLPAASDSAQAEEAGDAEDESPLIPLVEDWLNAALSREKRRMVEEHPELLSDESKELVAGLLPEFADQPTQRRELQDHLRLIARLHGQSDDLHAVREAYVDSDGGLALDVPEWLEEQERELHHVTHTHPAAQRVALLRQMLARAEADPAVVVEARAELQARLWDALDDLVTAAPAEPQEEGIALLQAALKVYTLDRFPQQYARMHIYLGNSYQERVSGKRRENLELAIACYGEALRVYDKASFPDGYALAYNNLGNTHHLRVAGSHRDNLEEALACYQQALQVYTLEADRENYAMVQGNLGNTYLRRVEGEERANLEAAIACFQEALQVYTQNDFPRDYATQHLGLGAASYELGSSYFSRLEGSASGHFERAIAHYEEALRVFSRTDFPLDYARAQAGLGDVYRERMFGNRRDNLEEAIAAYRTALEVYTREALPASYASTQADLGHTYRKRIAGTRHDNLKQAIACYQEALQVFTPEDFPRQFRDAQLALAWIALSEQAPEAEAGGDQDAARQAYQQAHAYYLVAREIQAELMWLESTAQGHATVRGGWTGLGEMYQRDAWCLCQLGELREAMVALEAGRAQALAEAQALAGLPLIRVCAGHSHAFNLASQALQEARLLEDRALLRQARDELLKARQAIRAHCQPGFLPGEPDFVSIAQAATTEALVYLAATDLGGFALILPPAQREAEMDQQPHLIPLPELTWNRVDDWLVRGQVGGAVEGGFRVALEHEGAQMLRNWVNRWQEGLGIASEQPALAVQDVPAVLPDEFATLRTALSELLASWRGAPDQLTQGTPAQRQQASKMQARLLMPLGEALQTGALRRELGWPFLKAELEQVLLELSATIMQPLRQALDTLHLDATDYKLALIPCGRLGILPLHAAPVDDVKNGRQVPFQETCECTYQASARILAASRSKVDKFPPIGALLTVGDPQPTAMASLPWAEAEAESLISLAEKAGQQARQALVGEEATLGRVKQELQRLREQPGAWVEIASHGHADPLDHRNCYMLLSHNERLTLADLQRERLLDGIRCFVASGCVTGVGDLDTAPDELGSFAAGVLQAGAACAIATLWSVSDRATFLLMLRFHQRILGDPHISPAQALRDAARWLRQATRRELDQLARDGLKGLRPLPSESAALPRDTLRGVGSREGKELLHEALSDALRLSADQALGQFRLAGSSEQASECPYAHPIYWAGMVMYGV